jgi:hypothetical protein
MHSFSSLSHRWQTSVLVWEGEHFALALVQASQAFRFLISWGVICKFADPPLEA